MPNLSRAALCLMIVGACAPGEGDGSAASATDTDSEVDTDTDTDMDSDTDTDTDVDTDWPTADTGPVVWTGDTSLSATASCELTDDNALRAWCDVTVTPPQPVAIRFAKSLGGPDRVHHSDATAIDHRVGLYMMANDTEYSWWLESPDGTPLGPSGSFQTGVVPLDAQLSYTVSGTSDADYVLHQSPCVSTGYVMVASTEGEMLWYQELATGGFIGVDGVNWTPSNTVLAMAGESVVEVDWMGNELFRADRFVHFSERLHHDVGRDGDYTYALFNESVTHNGDSYTLDGFYVFEPDGTLVETWRLFDHFQPPAPDPTVGPDYSHGNAIWVDDGLALLSFRHMSTVIQVDADPTSATFGEVLWRMEGDPTDAHWDSDYTLTTSLPATVTTIEKQHNPHLGPSGELMLFDNRRDVLEPSRWVELELDPGSGTADIVDTYQLPLHCDFQGGAWTTVGDNPFATCAPFRTAYEYERGASAHHYSVQAACLTGINIYLPRFVPVDP